MKNAFGEEFPALGAPAFRALHNKGIKNLKSLTRFSEEELLSLHGFGPKALRLLKQTLKANGMTFLKNKK